MVEALSKAESLGAKIVYVAPLMTVPEVVEKYKTVQMSQIGSKLDPIHPIEWILIGFRTLVGVCHRTVSSYIR